MQEQLYLKNLKETDVIEELQREPRDHVCMELCLIQGLDFLENAPTMTKLQITCCFFIYEDQFEQIAKCPELDSLCIDYSNTLFELSFLAALTHLTKLEITRCCEVVSIAPLRALPQLTYLDLASTGQVFIDDFSPISELKNLEYLDLSNNVCLKDCDFLSGLTKLKHLNLNFCTNLEDVSALEHLVHLESLHLKGCHGVEEQVDSMVRRKQPKNFTHPR